ncbi:MAG: hypothetical protein IPL78_29545 [Chloroflexi bacterium]|nr:hypothetical protein [Chloroflexota bacterium]
MPTSSPFNPIRPRTYHLFIGFYDPDTAQRLPTFQDGAPQPDQRLWLTDITILP